MVRKSDVVLVNLVNCVTLIGRGRSNNMSRRRRVQHLWVWVPGILIGTFALLVGFFLIAYTPRAK